MIKFFLSFLIAIPAQAYFITASVQDKSYNDEIDGRFYTASFANQASDFLWNYPEEDINAFNYSFSVWQREYSGISNIDSKLTDYSLLLDKTYGNRNYQINLKSSTLNGAGFEDIQQNFLDAKFSHRLPNSAFLILGFENYFIAMAAPNFENLKAKQSTSRKFLRYYDFRPNYRLKFSSIFGSFSDDNSMYQIQSSISFPFLKGKVDWFWLGIAAEHLEYDKTSSNYWSPATNTSIAGTLELSHKTSADSLWYYSLGVNLGQSKEDDLGWNSSQSFGINIRYGNRGVSTVAIEHGSYKGETWEENGNTINMTHSFPTKEQSE